MTEDMPSYVTPQDIIRDQQCRIDTLLREMLALIDGYMAILREYQRLLDQQSVQRRGD